MSKHLLLVQLDIAGSIDKDELRECVEFTLWLLETKDGWEFSPTAVEVVAVPEAVARRLEI